MSAPNVPRRPTPPAKRAGRVLPKKSAGQATGPRPRRLDGEVLDITATAALLGTSAHTIRARAARGLLPHRRWAGRIVFLRREVLEFLTKLDGCTLAEALANVATRTGGRS
jgi:hypothetical protein